MTLDLKREMKQRTKKTGIVEVDRMLDKQMTLMLAYEDYCSVSKGSWCDSAGLRAKLGVLLSAQRFLMVNASSILVQGIFNVIDVDNCVGVVVSSRHTGADKRVYHSGVSSPIAVVAAGSSIRTRASRPGRSRQGR